ncbi:hypothetical protein CCACVL1_02279, partial [Corchorus capsularis]
PSYLRKEIVNTQPKRKDQPEFSKKAPPLYSKERLFKTTIHTRIGKLTSEQYRKKEVSHKSNKRGR